MAAKKSPKLLCFCQFFSSSKSLSQSITHRDNYLMVHYKTINSNNLLVHLHLHKGGTFNYKGGGVYFLNFYFQTKFS